MPVRIGEAALVSLEQHLTVLLEAYYVDLVNRLEQKLHERT